jgi:class 3 adenylate cyclase
MVEIANSLPTKWKVRVGVHLGSVVAGVVGNRQYLFDLWGDTVNTASRIESHGAEGHVNVSSAVWEALQDRFHATPRGQVMVKGKGEMDLYQILGRKS